MLLCSGIPKATGSRLLLPCNSPFSVLSVYGSRTAWRKEICVRDQSTRVEKDLAWGGYEKGTAPAQALCQLEEDPSAFSAESALSPPWCCGGGLSTRASACMVRQCSCTILNPRDDHEQAQIRCPPHFPKAFLFLDWYIVLFLGRDTTIYS